MRLRGAEVQVEGTTEAERSLPGIWTSAEAPWLKAVSDGDDGRWSWRAGQGRSHGSLEIMV